MSNIFNNKRMPSTSSSWDDTMVQTPSPTEEIYFNGSVESLMFPPFSGDYGMHSTQVLSSPIALTMPLYFDNTENVCQEGFYMTPGGHDFTESFDISSPVRFATPFQMKEEFNSPASSASATGSTYNQSFSSYSPCSSSMSTPSCHGRYIKAEEVLLSSSALQSVQSSLKPSVTARRQAKLQLRQKATTSGIPSEEDFREQFPDTKVKRSGTRKHACSVSGCNAKFERTEHVKRHEATVHDPLKFKCRFCPAGSEKCFPKGRMDNYKDHLKRHADPKESRTKHNSDAAIELALMNSRAGKRAKKSRCKP